MPLKHIDKGYSLFEMWTDPRNAIKAAVERPSIPLSILAFFLPVLVILLNMLILGVQINFPAVIFNSILDLAVFAISVGLLYLFARNYLREKNVYWRCFAALSLSRMIYALFLVLSLVFLLVHGSFAHDLAQSINGQIAPQEVISNALAVDSLPRDIAVTIFLLVSFFFILWTVYAYFLAIRETVSDETSVQILVLIVFLVGSYAFNIIVRYAVLSALTLLA